MLDQIISMLDQIIIFFSQFPPQLATFFLSMLPITELRGALPLAIFSFHLSFWQAYFFSVLGNLIPAAIILFFAKPFHQYITKKSGILTRGWIKYLERAQKKLAGKYEKSGLVALMLFVAIPLPFTGAWTGAVAAFVLGIPFKKSFLSVSAGVLIAGIIVGILTLGIKGII